jgi:predicted nucleic acid-binding protein
MTNDALKYVVVDTDVFSLLFRRQDVALYQPHLTRVVPVLSFVSVAELHYGATMANWGERRRRDLAEAVRRYLIAPYNEELAKLWGHLKAQAVRTGHPLGNNSQANDLWICATAIYYSAPFSAPTGGTSRTSRAFCCCHNPRWWPQGHGPRPPGVMLPNCLRCSGRVTARRYAPG